MLTVETGRLNSVTRLPLRLCIVPEIPAEEKSRPLYSVSRCHKHYGCVDAANRGLVAQLPAKHIAENLSMEFSFLRDNVFTRRYNTVRKEEGTVYQILPDVFYRLQF